VIAQHGSFDAFLRSPGSPEEEVDNLRDRFAGLRDFSAWSPAANITQSGDAPWAARIAGSESIGPARWPAAPSRQETRHG
jgi:hypothetical protein